MSACSQTVQAKRNRLALKRSLACLLFGLLSCIGLCWLTAMTPCSDLFSQPYDDNTYSVYTTSSHHTSYQRRFYSPGYLTIQKGGDRYRRFLDIRSISSTVGGGAPYDILILIARIHYWYVGHHHYCAGPVSITAFVGPWDGLDYGGVIITEEWIRIEVARKWSIYLDDGFDY